jgi:hypothetical protein
MAAARHIWPIVAAACLGLAVAIAAWFAVPAWEQRFAKAKFIAVASDSAAVLHEGSDHPCARRRYHRHGAEYHYSQCYQRTPQRILSNHPPYRQGMPHNTIEERRGNTLGVIVGAFQTEAGFESILEYAKLPQDVDLYLSPHTRVRPHGPSSGHRTAGTVGERLELRVASSAA